MFLFSFHCLSFIIPAHLSLPPSLFLSYIVLYCIRRLQLFSISFSSWHVSRLLGSLILSSFVLTFFIIFHWFVVTLSLLNNNKKSPSILYFHFSLSLVKNTHSGRRRCWKLYWWFVFVFHLTKHKNNTHTDQVEEYSKTNLFFLSLCLVNLSFFLSSFAIGFWSVFFLHSFLFTPRVIF